jgi:hypothetical protein
MTRAQQAWYRRPAGKVSLKAAKFAEKLLSSCRTLMSAALSPAVSIVAALERLWSVKTKSAIRVKRPRLRHGKVGSNVERLENCDDKSRASHTTTGRKGLGKTDILLVKNRLLKIYAIDSFDPAFLANACAQHCSNEEGYF